MIEIIPDTVYLEDKNEHIKNAFEKKYLPIQPGDLIQMSSFILMVIASCHPEHRNDGGTFQIVFGKLLLYQSAETVSYHVLGLHNFGIKWRLFRLEEEELK